MTAVFWIHLGDNEQFEDLREWMGGHQGVVVDAVAHPSDPRSQGSVWDFLSVTCATGGPLVTALRALQLWIEARVTVIEVVVGDNKFVVRSQDAGAALSEVTAAIRALESAPGELDEPA